MSTQPPWPAEPSEPSRPDDRDAPAAPQAQAPFDPYGAPQDTPAGYPAQPYGAPQYPAAQYPAAEYPAPPPAVAPGYPQYGPAYNYGPGSYGAPVVPTNGLAIASLICGVTSFMVGITAPVAVILGILALRQIQRDGTQGRGMAIAGIAVGGAVTVGGLLIVVAYLGFFAVLIGTSGFST
ncbi:DUF4190 domain-containing protein [Pengzhenrongella sp.]|jgi:hypothetical protein|uniref:DUF4190 domain-containing protein n=1 Tax=Pengzhenrongella sp. TaxID=2888820 RepID=UPI002F93CFBB